jgi:hypothetical protein
MLVLHQPLHRQLQLWRMCGLLGRLQMEFFVTNIHSVPSSRRATYATISQRPFGHITRFGYFPLEQYIVHLVGLIKEYTGINITYTYKSHLFIYDVVIYFFIRGSFNNVVGNSGQLHSMEW